MKKVILLWASLCLYTTVCMAQADAVILKDSTKNEIISLNEVVVTGTRIPLSRDVIPVPITVVHRSTLEQAETTTLLPVLMQ